MRFCLFDLVRNNCDPCIPFQCYSPLALADTLNNRVRLADEYVKKGHYGKAKALYEQCLSGPYADDVPILLRLLDTSFREGDFDTVVSIGRKVHGKPLFRKSDRRIDFAWALYHLDHVEQARTEFSKMDVHYTNYPHRLAYARFLHLVGEEKASQELLGLLVTDMDQMSRTERRSNAKIITRIKQANRYGFNE